MHRLALAASAAAARRAAPRLALRSLLTAAAGRRPALPAPRLPVAVRWASDNLGGQVMPLDECVEIYKKVLVDLKTIETALANLKVAAAPIAMRWNQLMLALMLARLNALKARNPGYTDQDAYIALQRLSISCRKHALDNAGALKAVDRDTWEFLLRAGFGKPLPEELPLPVVRKVALALCNSVSDEAFQAKLRGACTGKDINSKNQVLVTALMEAQMDIFKTFGYHGEDGYICLQKSLVDFAGDTVVLAFTSAYNTILLEVAEIDPSTTQLPKIG